MCWFVLMGPPTFDQGLRFLIFKYALHVSLSQTYYMFYIAFNIIKFK